MNILFIGGTKRGFKVLEAISSHKIVGVISLIQDEHESERFEASIENFCNKNKILHLQTKRINTEEVLNFFKDVKPDLGIVVGARVLLPEAVYNLPVHGSLAVHDSLLPKYRGFCPSNWCLINGEKETGVSLFKISEKMDEGAVYLQQKITITPNMYIRELQDKIIEATKDVIVQFLAAPEKNLENHSLQDESLATYTCARTPDDGEINWNWSSTKIFNFIRAQSFPMSGSYSFYGGQKVYIWKATIPEIHRQYIGRIPGRIVEIHSNGEVDILSNDGLIRIQQITVDGDQNLLKPSDFLRSIKRSLGK